MTNDKILFLIQACYFGAVGILLSCYIKTLMYEKDKSKQEFMFVLISLVTIIATAVAKYLWL